MWGKFLNAGQTCVAPDYLLVEETIQEQFLEMLRKYIKEFKYDQDSEQYTRIINQRNFQRLIRLIDKEKLYSGGNFNEEKLYIEPTILNHVNWNDEIMQEEIFGPVLAFTTFKDEEEAVKIANDTIYGLGAGVWTRDAHQLYNVPRQIEAGRVWVNQYHSYPAGAPFGGYKQSGIGRENHKMMLDHYRQTKNMLISYNKNKLGFF